jgi:hypothetical protein
MKRYWTIVKQEAEEWVLDNWKSKYYFDKTKVIFVGFILFLFIIKIIHSIFS